MATLAPPATETRAAPSPTAPRLNPVLDQDFPDPDVMQVGETYYAYSTNANGRNIPVARSTDLRAWVLVRDALPALPKWAAREFGWAWAPDVSAMDDDTFRMYFTARFVIERGGTQCIGVATAAAPEGPFEADAAEPFICQVGEGGSIDPATFVDDDGARYLLWKNDGNSGGGQTWIYLQRLSADGLSLEGEPVRLLTADQIWEGVLVEGPTLWKHADRYYLFYSANAYDSPRYAVGYAVADSIEGPYEKAAQPILKTDLKAGWAGPGGQDIVTGPDDALRLLFHDWAPGSYRHLNLAGLEWRGAEPVVMPLAP